VGCIIAAFQLHDRNPARGNIQPASRYARSRSARAGVRPVAGIVWYLSLLPSRRFL
jgi:hypothetical protein